MKVVSTNFTQWVFMTVSGIWIFNFLNLQGQCLSPTIAPDREKEKKEKKKWCSLWVNWGTKWDTHFTTFHLFFHIHSYCCHNLVKKILQGMSFQIQSYKNGNQHKTMNNRAEKFFLRPRMTALSLLYCWFFIFVLPPRVLSVMPFIMFFYTILFLNILNVTNLPGAADEN